jgi:aspartate racemase
MTQHIGIAGCSAEGAALCYKTICLEGQTVLGQHVHPEVSMHTPSLSDYVDCLEKDDIAGIGELMLQSAIKLAAIGADFVICPDNTVHQTFDSMIDRSPLPWLHIGEVVAAEAARRKFQRLGLTGTSWLVASDVYPAKLANHGLGFARPNQDECKEIDRIIMEELTQGIFKPSAIASFQKVIDRMGQEGCDAVILGCTEIPLIMDDTNSPLPTLDSTRLLARAALERATSDN